MESYNDSVDDKEDNQFLIALENELKHLMWKCFTLEFIDIGFLTDQLCYSQKVLKTHRGWHQFSQNTTEI